mmetsp:Transcript_11284/g.14683  ORF Transcript_11284/g.14683 Transcript_11284/m.14683 type:complete len:536 (+) Transcript_11284:329-1936(+)
MSSTLMSTDLNVTRSTTRRHAPPGGRTSVFLGDAGDSRPKTAPPAPMVVGGLKLPKVPSTASSRRSSRRPSIVDAVKQGVSTKPVGIALCVDLLAVADCLGQTCKSILRFEGYTNIRVYEVYDVQQLATACAWLIKDQHCEAVVAFGTLLDDNFASGHLSTSINQALFQLSSNTNTPVVPGLLFAANRDAALEAAPKHAERAAMGLASFLRAQSGNPDIKTRGVGFNSTSERARMTAAALSGANTEVPASTLELMKQLKESIKAHGASGIIGLGRKFRIMDDNQNGELDLDEFKKAIAEHALDWTDEQVAEVHAWFDEDNSGGISYDEFLFGLRGELNERRSQLVLQAFQILDTDKSGTIEVSDLHGRYNCSKHPKVIDGSMTENEVLTEFLNTFEYGEKDGKVSVDEWCRYYGHVSMSIDDDDYFELMMRNAWHISGGEGVYENSSCRRVLVTHEDGRQTVEEIKNDLGIAQDDKEAMINNLKEQGIAVVGIDLFGSTDNTTPPTKPAPSAFDQHPTPNRRRHAPGGQSSFTFG